jgi:bifunctional DNA-binding transcriptional regulator/antitoxin component of YhaV-PrlF toxin-antitoxin module
MAMIRAEARMRARNQLTLPERVVSAAGIRDGDSLVVEVDEHTPDVVRLRRVRSSYAGVVRGLYGDTRAYLEQERRSWDDREHGVP